MNLPCHFFGVTDDFLAHDDTRHNRTIYDLYIAILRV
jgi:hypothetical protein